MYWCWHLTPFYFSRLYWCIYLLIWNEFSNVSVLFLFHLGSLYVLSCLSKTIITKTHRIILHFLTEIRIISALILSIWLEFSEHDYNGCNKICSNLISAFGMRVLNFDKDCCHWYNTNEIYKFVIKTYVSILKPVAICTKCLVLKWLIDMCNFPCSLVSRSLNRLYTTCEYLSHHTLYLKLRHQSNLFCVFWSHSTLLLFDIWNVNIRKTRN